MSPFIPYEALAILPVAFLLGSAFNPIEFSWAFRHGLDQLPDDVRERAATVGRYANFLGDGLILGLVAVLMMKHSVAAARVGLHLAKWKTNIAVGTAAGVLLIGLQRLAIKSVPRGRPSPFAYRVRRGSVSLWVIVFAAGAFSEELWMAFCLVSLATTGHPVIVSIAITETVFAAVHYGYRLGGMVAVGLKGTLSAILFIWCGSLIPMVLVHFIGNLGSLFWARHRQ
ncbi:MAG TPA: CPBP family intramembrane glutamic endopeptidase [Candidatus Acidoferrales bacterium]|nr:CPBP family intramembrane glutamic endopeptidase [Candidatus Acidoferrales bacterium]